jgi:hypothetical protein
MILLAVACYCYGAGFCRALVSPGRNVADFFQEWASARNWYEGRPIYTPQRETMRDYLNFAPLGGSFVIEINAHPPTAVFLALPIGALQYGAGFLVWNWLSLAAVGISLWLVVREAGLRLTRWAWLPILTLLMGNPFLQHLAYGQLSAFLLLLMTLAWVADRRGHSAWAGALLATATAIKLFPGFLFLYFLVKGKWRTIAAGAVTFVALTGLTAIVLGTDTFSDYITRALPEVNKYRDYWGNLSLHGFWLRLLDGEAKHTTAIMHAPELARALGYVSSAVVVAVFALIARQSRRRETDDLLFGLQIVAMLLVSPIAWDHYLILLVQPIALVACRLSQPDATRGLFRAALALLWLNPFFFWAIFLGATLTSWSALIASPQQNLVIVSLSFYALAALFAISALVTRRAIAASGEEGVVPVRKELPLVEEALVAAR